MASNLTKANLRSIHRQVENILTDWQWDDDNSEKSRLQSEMHSLKAFVKLAIQQVDEEDKDGIQ